MGIHFDLSMANWVAHLTQPGSSVPAFSDPCTEREALRQFLDRLRGQFYSTPERVHELSMIVDATEAAMGSVNGPEFREAFLRLRRFMGDRPWTALIIPTGQNWEVDSYLGSKGFLEKLVRIKPDEPGLILQLEHLGPASD